MVSHCRAAVSRPRSHTDHSPCLFLLSSVGSCTASLCSHPFHHPIRATSFLSSLLPASINQSLLAPSHPRKANSRPGIFHRFKMLPFHKLVRRIVLVSLALGLVLVAAEVNVARHASPPPTFSFSFFRLIPSSLLLLSSSPSITAGQRQRHRNSIGKSHRPSTGPFPHPPSLSDVVPSEDKRFSTNRPPNPPPTLLRQANNEFILERPNSDTNNNNKHDNPTRPYQPTTKMTPSPLLAHFPDPIVYQFTLYYPGNLPLIVTAGHGGQGVTMKRRMTHHFTPVDLSGPISVANFSTPVDDRNPDQPEVMPWMPERNQTKGSKFLRDVNTHSAALNLAGAVACIINEDLSKHQLSASSVPLQCNFADSDDYDLSPPMTPSQGLSSQDNPSFYYPHVVIFRVPRQFVDVNRNDTGENAFPDHPVAEAAWNEYHNLIDHVQKIVSQGNDESKDPKEPKGPSKGSGLLLDIHGSLFSFVFREPFFLSMS